MCDGFDDKSPFVCSSFLLICIWYISVTHTQIYTHTHTHLQEVEAGERAGGPAVENLLGRHSDEQPREGPTKRWEQTHAVSSESARTHARFHMNSTHTRTFTGIPPHTHTLYRHYISFQYKHTSVLYRQWYTSFRDYPQTIHTNSYCNHVPMCFALQRGSNYGSLLTGDGNFQVFAKTGYYKVRSSVCVCVCVCLLVCVCHSF